jgi:hypothetical protein
MVPVIPGEQADLFGVQHIEPGPQGAELLKTICQDFYAHKIKRLILGQTLTSEAESTGMGSGVADAHLATFSDIIRYDAVNLQESLTDDFIQVLKEENFPWARGIHIRLILNTERPETQEKLAAYNAAWSMGLKVRAEDLYNLIGARRPDQEDEVLQNPNIMMAEQQQAMMAMQMGAPPPGAAPPGDPTQVAMGDAGPAVAAMGQPPMEVEKSAADQPGAQPVNPWAGFWDSLFAAARGQGVPPPAGQPGIARPVGNTNPVDHVLLTRLFQERFREAILTRRQTAAQFREALEQAIAQQPDRDNLQLRLGFLFAWKKAEPVQNLRAAFQEAIDSPDAVHSVVNQANPVKAGPGRLVTLAEIDQHAEQAPLTVAPEQAEVLYAATDVGTGGVPVNERLLRELELVGQPGDVGAAPDRTAAEHEVLAGRRVEVVVARPQRDRQLAGRREGHARVQGSPERVPVHVRQLAGDSA